MGDHRIPPHADNFEVSPGLQDVLRYAIANTDPNNPTSRDEIDMQDAQDPDRRGWLREALTEMCTDLHEEMKNGISNLQEVMKRFKKDGKLAEDDYILVDTTCDNLIEIVSGIDFAQDCVKIGGYEVLKEMTESNDDRLIVKACDVLAETLQNNPYCQRACVEKGFLDLFVRILNSETEEEPQIKALYALSCLLRANINVQKVFEQEYDGYALLHRLLEKPSKPNKLCIKTAFLLADICQQQPNVKEVLCEMGFIPTAVALLRTNYECREHLLSFLHAMVHKHERSKKICRDPNLKLEELLQEILEEVKWQNSREGLWEFSEMLIYCQNLLKIFSKSKAK